MTTFAKSLTRNYLLHSNKMQVNEHIEDMSSLPCQDMAKERFTQKVFQIPYRLGEFSSHDRILMTICRKTTQLTLSRCLLLKSCKELC